MQALSISLVLRLLQSYEKLSYFLYLSTMKKLDGEILIEEVEIQTLKSEPKKVGYKFKVNAYPVNQLNEWRKMLLVIDGELEAPNLLGYHIGNGEYWVGDSRPRKKKPKNIELYKY